MRDLACRLARVLGVLFWAAGLAEHERSTTMAPTRVLSWSKRPARWSRPTGCSCRSSVRSTAHDHLFPRQPPAPRLFNPERSLAA